MDEIFNRRSIRKYQDKKIPDEDIKLILKAGMSAPSAMNEKPWQFIVIDDKTLMNSITEYQQYSQMLKEASHAIMVCCDTAKPIPYLDKMWVQDCSAATENMLIMAQHLGIGNVWLGVYGLDQVVVDLKELFKLPEEIIPFSIVSLGYPAEERKIRDRYNESLVHYNNW